MGSKVASNLRLDTCPIADKNGLVSTFADSRCLQRSLGRGGGCEITTHGIDGDPHRDTVIVVRDVQMHTSPFAVDRMPSAQIATKPKCSPLH